MSGATLVRGMDFTAGRRHFDRHDASSINGCLKAEVEASRLEALTRRWRPVFRQSVTVGSGREGDFDIVA
jgi:hypothetical protein